MIHAQIRGYLTMATKRYISTVTRQARLCVSFAMRAMNSLGKSSLTVSQDTHLNGTAHHPSVKVRGNQLVH